MAHLRKVRLPAGRRDESPADSGPFGGIKLPAGRAHGVARESWVGNHVGRAGQDIVVFLPAVRNHAGPGVGQYEFLAG